MSDTNLFLSLPSTIHNRGIKPGIATTTLAWHAATPSEIRITVWAGTCEEWTVARSTFIAANAPIVRGTWVGGGDFSACYAGHRLMLGFTPRSDKTNSAILLLAAEPVAQFIDHSSRLVPATEETDINLRSVDLALERIMRNA